MKGYILFQEDVFDQATFEKYKELSSASLVEYGGNFIVRGGQFNVLEGDFAHERVVIIEFPTVAQAEAWYDSEGYAAAKKLRLKASKGQAILITGV